MADTGWDLAVTWIRRTRIDGDLWGAGDVPLGETTEAYLVRVRDGTAMVRQATVTATTWTYDAAAQSSDAISGGFAIEVAQISERFGPGLFRRIKIDG